MKSCRWRYAAWVLVLCGALLWQAVQAQPAAVATSASASAAPSAWEEIIFFTHPSARTRIFNAMRWREQMLAADVAPARP